MTNLWTHFRHLVTSLMLVAVASFVLHSGALAGMHRHGQGSPDCEQTTSSGLGHQHDPQAAAHVHQADAGPEGSCCASACPIAMAPLGLDTISAPMTLALSLVPGSQRGSGIDPGHLKRPPRTPCIA